MGGSRAAFTVIVGAALFQAPAAVLAADCNGDGMDDAQGLARGASRDCDRNCVPDECDLRPAFGIAGDQRVPLGGAASSLTLADLDGDRRPDIITANYGAFVEPGTNVSVLWNEGG